jgi:spore coat protein CotF
VAIQLTQKERMLLQDQLRHEQACIEKYGSYAKQVQDVQLRQLFTQHQQHEQQHYDTINQFLQGKMPNMAAGGQSQSAQLSPHSVTGVATNQRDDFMCHDLLMTEKYVSGTYDTAVFESVNPQLRQALQHIQKEEQQHGEDIFNYMQQHGMYGLQ